MTGIRSTVFTIGFTTRVKIDNVHEPGGYWRALQGFTTYVRENVN